MSGEKYNLPTAIPFLRERSFPCEVIIFHMIIESRLKSKLRGKFPHTKFPPKNSHPHSTANIWRMIWMRKFWSTRGNSADKWGEQQLEGYKVVWEISRDFPHNWWAFQENHCFHLLLCHCLYLEMEGGSQTIWKWKYYWEILQI